MAGIHRPTSGRIAAQGRLSALLELGSGFHPELTGRENVFLNGAMLGLGRRQMAAAMDGIIEFSGVGDQIDAPVKIYSSGMYMRLGFSVAVNVDPEILLVDEVIAVGDEEFQHRCLHHMEALRAGGRDHRAGLARHRAGAPALRSRRVAGRRTAPGRGRSQRGGRRLPPPCRRRRR